MAESFKITFTNDREVTRAIREAPKIMQTGINREWKRGVRKWRNKSAANLYRGAHGLHIPAQEKVDALKVSQKGKKGKQGAGSIRKRKEIAHLVARAFRVKSLFVWLGYLSLFGAFHFKLIGATFHRLFRGQVRDLQHRIDKEVKRLAQAWSSGKLTSFRSKRV